MNYKPTTSAMANMAMTAERQQSLMRRFAMLSTILGILLSTVTTIAYSSSYYSSHLTFSQKCVGCYYWYWYMTYFGLVLVGVLQTSSSVLIFHYSNNQNQESPRTGWIITSAINLTSLFLIYFALNYFNYLHFQRSFTEPVILNVVVFVDMIFLLISLIFSLVFFQKMLDGNNWNGEGDPSIVILQCNNRGSENEI